MRSAFLFLLLGASAAAQEQDDWTIERPKPDNTIGLEAPPLLRMEKKGQTQKLSFTWDDRIDKFRARPTNTSLSIETTARVTNRTQFLCHLSLPLRVTSITVDGEDATPRFENPRLTTRITPYSHVIGGFAEDGVGKMGAALSRICHLAFPPVPMREYKVGDVIAKPPKDFLKGIGMTTDDAKVSGQVYVQMPQALYRAGRSATLITTFSVRIDGDRIRLPSGAEHRGFVRLKGRRVARYEGLDRGGYLSSCQLKMVAEHVIHDKLKRGVVRIESNATVSGATWSAPPDESGKTPVQGDTARIRWDFRKGSSYGLSMEQTLVRDGKRSDDKLKATLWVDSLTKNRAQFTLLRTGAGNLRGELTNRGEMLPATLPERLRRLLPVLPRREMITLEEETPLPLKELRESGIFRIQGGQLEGTAVRVFRKPRASLVIATTTFDVHLKGDDLRGPGSLAGTGEVHIKGTRVTRLFMGGRVALTHVIYVNRSTLTVERTGTIGGRKFTEREELVVRGEYPEAR